jgi:hypothetical protein
VSFVNVVTEAVSSAAKALEGIGFDLTAASSAAAAPTSGIAAAAQDEVSLAVSTLFGGYGREFQELSARAQALHAQFVSTLNAGVGVQTPVNAVRSFFFGGQYFAGSVPVPSNTGYSSAVYAVPIGGLFSPLSSVVVTLYSTTGTPTTFALSGTEFGGPFYGIASLFPS